MTMSAKKKGGGSNLTRSQIVTVRLDPKLKFAAELAARKQRRTISSFIEWAVEEAVEKVGLSESETIKEIMNKVWDVDEPERFIRLATSYPDLLSFDEERLWKLIQEYRHFWGEPKSNIESNPIIFNEKVLDRSLLNYNWPTLNKIISGEASYHDLSEVPFPMG
jgi:hypothetical protein